MPKKKTPERKNVLIKEIRAYIDLDYTDIRDIINECEGYILDLSKFIQDGSDRYDYTMRFIVKDGYYDSKDTYAQLVGPETDKQYEERIQYEENATKIRKENELKDLKSDIKKLSKKERDLLLQDLVKETK
jgi:hypothetical protein